eukprot:6460456-Lingulodinium_polyedra.AAC.1
MRVLDSRCCSLPAALDLTSRCARAVITATGLIGALFAHCEKNAPEMHATLYCSRWNSGCATFGCRAIARRR